MAQVGNHSADSLEGAEEEDGRASVGFQGCWSSVCIRQGMPEKQESSIYCKPRGQREDVLTCQIPGAQGSGTRISLKPRKWLLLPIPQAHRSS